MGLISFIKDAGKKIFGGDDDQQQDTSQSAVEQVKQQREARRAELLERHVGNLGLAVENVDISIDGEKVTVRGKAANQTEREKVALALGNVAGVSEVIDEMEVDQTEPEATYYTVKSGDTLSGIAKTQYGAANKYMVIFDANKPMLEDPDKIYPGQVLRIPPLG